MDYYGNEYLEGPFDILNETEIDVTTNSPDDSPRNFNHPPRTRSFLEILTHYLIQVCDTINVGLNISSTVACIFLIFIFIRYYKRLKSRVHVYLLHYIIWTFIWISLGTVYKYLHYLGLHHVVHSSCICISYRMDTISVLFLYAFITMLAVNWFIFYFNNNWVDLYNKSQKLIIGCIYTIHFVLFFIYISVECFGASQIITDTIGVIYYFIMFLILITINCVNFYKIPSVEQVESRYVLKISTFLLFTWLPIFGFYLAYYLGADIFVIYPIYLIFESLPAIGPLFLIYWLNKWDYNFHKACRSTFRRSGGFTQQEDQIVIKNPVYRNTVQEVEIC